MIRRLLILVSAAALAGCTLVINVGYGLLDSALVWYVRDYFPLDARQEAVLRSGLAEVRQWHCATQLPQYAQWLRSVSGELQRGMSREDVSRRAAQVQDHWRDVLRRLAPVLARTFETASDQQIAALKANFEKSNAEYRAEWVELSRAALAAKRRDRATTQITHWTGALNDLQVDEILRWSRGFEPTGADWLAYRERWQRAFVGALQDRARAAGADAAVARLFVDYDTLWEPALRQKIAANRAATLDMIYRVQRLMTDAQRRQVGERAAAYAAEFDRLACPAPQPAAAAPR